MKILNPLRPKKENLLIQPLFQQNLNLLLFESLLYLHSNPFPPYSLVYGNLSIHFDILIRNVEFIPVFFNFCLFFYLQTHQHPHFRVLSDQYHHRNGWRIHQFVSTVDQNYSGMKRFSLFLILLLQTTICKYIIINSEIDDLKLLSISLRVIYNLFQACKFHLKIQLEVFFVSIYLRNLNRYSALLLLYSQCQHQSSSEGIDLRVLIRLLSRALFDSGSLYECISLLFVY